MLDTYDRIDLTGPWAGFGFQGYKFFSPEGHAFDPEELLWLSLTFNLAREWRTMMAEARSGSSPPPAGSGDVIHLRHALLRRRERRLSTMGGARFADPATVVRATRRHTHHGRR